MNGIKCACGDSKMFVYIRHSCDECPENGFYIDYDVVKELNVEECAYYHDENIKRKAEEIIGTKIVRTEVEEEGECKMGSSGGSGCSMYICSSCRENVDFTPFIGEC